MRLKIYTDKKFLPPGKAHIQLLYPFWGNCDTNSEDPDFGRFEAYCKTGEQFFEFSEPQDCDVFVLPFDYSPDVEIKKNIQAFTDLAKSFSKKVLVFYNADDDSKMAIDNAIVFRTSFYKSKKEAYEFAFPGWSIDFLKYINKGIVTLPKSILPRVSYCGYVDYLSVAEKLKLHYSILRKHKNREIGPHLRGKIVRSLLKDKRIKSNFIIRNGFWAQGIEDKKAARLEYINNLLESEYALVTRGGGNFSYRLYEVMSCGRIPVFINTDSVLPFEEYIDWKNKCVWVEQNELPLLGQKILEFQRNFTDDAFLELQQDIRMIYENWLCPSGFFKNIYRYIK